MMKNTRHLDNVPQKCQILYYEHLPKNKNVNY